MKRTAAALGLVMTVAACTVAACTGAGEDAPGDAAPGDKASGDKAGADDDALAKTPASCPALDSRDWSAWIDAQPGPGAAPTLHIRGVLDMPTPGWSYALRETFADRALPPGVHYQLDLEGPDGMVAQVVTALAIAHAQPASYPAYRTIVIHCGEETLAEITKIETAL